MTRSRFFFFGGDHKILHPLVKLLINQRVGFCNLSNLSTIILLELKCTPARLSKFLRTRLQIPGTLIISIEVWHSTEWKKTKHPSSSENFKTFLRAKMEIKLTLLFLKWIGKEQWKFICHKKPKKVGPNYFPY